MSMGRRRRKRRPRLLRRRSGGEFRRQPPGASGRTMHRPMQLPVDRAQVLVLSEGHPVRPMLLLRHMHQMEMVIPAVALWLWLKGVD